MKKFLFPLLFILVCLTSCQKEEVRLLDRESLFSLPLGVMPDELDYIYREKVLLPGTSDIFMKEGIVYISSENMGKVMGFNSYGDLITLIFNSDNNPLPRELALAEGNKDTNKRFSVWSFNRPGHLGLSGSNLLVEDQVKGAMVYHDELINAACDRILLRFDEQGNYIDYIGQEGIGGRPFPNIHDLAFRENGEFAVICKLNTSWWVFWYSHKGELLYRIEVDQDHFPFYKEGYQSFIPNLVVDPVKYRLYLMVNFYSLQENKEDSSQIKRVYQFDMNSQTYDKGAAIPDEVMREGGEEIRFIYDLVGVSAKGHVLMIAPIFYNRYVIVGMDEEGKFLFKREISIGREHSVYTAFSLSSEGILTSLCFQMEQAEISWWRTDRLFKE